jgi:CHAT domain-containing protein
LLDEARQGPIVILNVGQYRSDALVLQDHVELVGLPEVAPRVLIDQANKLLGAVEFGTVASAGQRAIAEVLEWLWHCVTGPIMERILPASGCEAGDEPPHVWWLPTAAMNFLPLHAAQAGEQGMLDLAISSYVPSIRALRHARSKAPVTVPASIVAVGVNEAQSAMPLTGPEREIAELEEKFANVVSVSGENATNEKVQALLREHAWAHFACHGVSYLHDPSASKLLLNDHETHPFTASAIAGLHLTSARLAFLSACETAKSGLELADETIHLTSGFLAAGFTNVVGTLWSIGDRAAVSMARHFYESILGSARVDPALSLNHASKKLRARHPEVPGLWAAHILAGR